MKPFAVFMCKVLNKTIAELNILSSKPLRLIKDLQKTTKLLLFTVYVYVQKSKPFYREYKQCLGIRLWAFLCCSRHLFTMTQDIDAYVYVHIN